MNKRILFLTPYPQDTAGSQRFRFEQYLQFLKEENIAFKCQSFLDHSTWKILYKEGHTIQKIIGILSGFLRRIGILFSLSRYDFVFVHREAAPIGPPIFEWCITKVWRKRLIFDFDDAIWIKNTSAQNILANALKYPQKTGKTISWSYKVSAGNQFLMDFAASHGGHGVYNPTTIDTVNRHIPNHHPNDPIVLGWTGTHSTLRYLEILRQPLKLLAEKYSFEFVIIADKQPEEALPNQRFIAWNKVSEIEDLNQIDIGVMPMENNPWAKGKCGFKALQFMALETPVLVSPIGVNETVVENGVQGYHCMTEEDWLERMSLLIKDKVHRNELGQAGRQKVEEEFSVLSNKTNFISLFS